MIIRLPPICRFSNLWSKSLSRRLQKHARVCIERQVSWRNCGCTESHWANGGTLDAIRKAGAHYSLRGYWMTQGAPESQVTQDAQGPMETKGH